MIYIATPIRSKQDLTPWHTASVSAILKKYGGRQVFVEGLSLVDCARNALLSRNWETGGPLDFTEDHVFWLDSDNGCEIEDFDRMIRANVDIIGLAYSGHYDKDSLVAGGLDADGDTTKLGAETTGLMEVGWMGSGCCLVKKSVYETIPAPWYGRTFHEGKKRYYYGEDIDFCMRAGAAGIRLYLDCDSRSKHQRKEIVEMSENTPKTLRKMNVPEEVGALRAELAGVDRMVEKFITLLAGYNLLHDKVSELMEENKRLKVFSIDDVNKSIEIMKESLDKVEE